VVKSSFLDSIFKIISGKDLPSKITKEGEKSGFVEIDLGAMKVKATFNEKNEKMTLSIENEDGSLYKSPRTMLDELAGVIDFDLNSFFALTPKKKVDFIKNLVGIDFTDLDERYKELFEERTYVNRKVKELESQQILFDKNKIESTPIEAIQEKIKAAYESNKKIDGIKAGLDQRKERITENKKTIDELTLKISELKKCNGVLIEEITKGNAWLEKNQPIATEDLDAEMNAAVEFNKEVEKNKRGLELSNQLKEQIKNQDHLNAELEKVENTKRRVIAESKMPIPGLTFDDNQLYLNGLPFEKSQINTAQLIIAGLQINLALLKDLKIARFDGSLLDSENMKLVEAWAKENDLQLFVEFVERNGEGLKIEIQE
jgi:hypothetical protein